MQDARGDVLYVGKARALKNRVTNYTQVARAAEAAAADGRADAVDDDRHDPDRGRGAAARGAADQALPAALQRAAARRQKLPVHPAARGPRLSARSEASRRAAGQGPLFRPVRQRRIGHPHAQRAAEAVPAAKLLRQLFREPRRGRACSTRSSAARRRASGGSARPIMPSWSTTRRTSSPASRPGCRRGWASRWPRRPRSRISSWPQSIATGSAR